MLPTAPTESLTHALYATFDGRGTPPKNPPGPKDKLNRCFRGIDYDDAGLREV